MVKGGRKGGRGKGKGKGEGERERGKGKGEGAKGKRRGSYWQEGWGKGSEGEGVES